MSESITTTPATSHRSRQYVWLGRASTIYAVVRLDQSYDVAVTVTISGLNPRRLCDGRLIRRAGFNSALSFIVDGVIAERRSSQKESATNHIKTSAHPPDMLPDVALDICCTHADPLIALLIDTCNNTDAESRLYNCSVETKPTLQPTNYIDRLCQFCFLIVLH